MTTSQPFERRGFPFAAVCAAAAAAAVAARLSDAPPIRAGASAVAVLLVATVADVLRRRRAPQSASAARRAPETDVLAEAIRALDAADDPEQVCETLAAEAARLFDGDAFVMWTPPGCRPRLAFPEAAARPATEAEARPWLARLARRTLPGLWDDATSVRDALGGDAWFAGATSVVAAAAGPTGAAAGAVFVARRGGAAFDSEAPRRLARLAEVAGRCVTFRVAERIARHERRRAELSLHRLGRAQEHLVRTERARAVADAVSGVAHELSNPLTAVSGYVQLLASRPELRGGPAADLLRDAQAEVDRCAMILRNLMGFARIGSDGDGAASPSGAVAAVLALKSYDLRVADVRVEADVPGDLPASAVERSVLQHVLLHLLNNAAAAVRGRDERTVRVVATLEAGGVALRVSDTGPGVPWALRRRIFEPFFTLKTRGESVGVGLAACRTLLEARGGSIDLEPAPDGGPSSTFVLRLPPASDAASDVARSESDPPSTRPTRAAAPRF
ncbi:MAG TPA: HAMP domain-containing sensor histidine kinase [Planctomycetota bacterium]|nr:HAMP domain-containing sensor histidine kinase [Planctomycetota bacterium]